MTGKDRSEGAGPTRSDSDTFVGIDPRSGQIDFEQLSAARDALQASLTNLRLMLQSTQDRTVLEALDRTRRTEWIPSPRSSDDRQSSRKIVRDEDSGENIDLVSFYDALVEQVNVSAGGLLRESVEYGGLKPHTEVLALVQQLDARLDEINPDDYVAARELYRELQHITA